MPPALGRQVAQAVATRIPVKAFGGFNHSWRISIYLDTPDFAMASRALSQGSQTTKLRAKKYYQLENGTELYDDIYWLEAKTRALNMVEKVRFRVHESEIVENLNGPVEQNNVSAEEELARQSFEKLRQENPLAPLFVVHYRRHTYQDKASTLRITLDDACTFHLPPRGIFTPAVPICSRRHLPPPIATESRWILEIKTIGTEPEWIAALTEGLAPTDYSKFVAGVNALREAGQLPADNPTPDRKTENVRSI
jgi:SPX domain protein involved in polyphosphate accumulation